MPTVEVYLSDEQLAKLVFIQEERNRKVPKTKGKTIDETATELLVERLDSLEVKATLKPLRTIVETPARQEE